MTFDEFVAQEPPAGAAAVAPSVPFDEWAQHEQAGPNRFGYLTRLSRFFTEGLPRAWQVFAERQQEPTFGQTINTGALSMTPIPGTLDLGERAARLFTSIPEAVAELGPEQAKPLTKALAGGAMLVPEALPAGVAALRGGVRTPVLPAPALPGQIARRPQLALPAPGQTGPFAMPLEVRRPGVVAEIPQRFTPLQYSRPATRPFEDAPIGLDLMERPPDPRLVTSTPGEGVLKSSLQLMRERRGESPILFGPKGQVLPPAEDAGFIRAGVAVGAATGAAAGAAVGESPEEKMVLALAGGGLGAVIGARGGNVRLPKATPLKADEPFALPLQTRTTAVSKKIDETVERTQGLNQRARLAIDESETIAETGTLSKEVRPTFRGAEALPVTEGDLKAFRLSANMAKEGMAEIVAAAQDVKRLRAVFQQEADPLSTNILGLAETQLKAAMTRMNRAVESANVQRFVTNRIMKSYDLPIPADVIQTLQDTGALVKGLREVKERVPIATNILNSLKRWNDLKPAERSQLWRDVVDHVRLNLFATTSFTLDAFGNAAELTAQTVGGVAHDIVYLTRAGTASFPATQGLFRALRDRAANFAQPMAQAFEESFGKTFSGEKITGGATGARGAFTYRGNLGSTIYDYAVGLPLYAKGAVDTAAKRLASTTYIQREAIKAADAAGLRGAGRQQFYERYVRNLPDDVAQGAMEQGNKAGFNRSLSDIEERYASNLGVRVAVDVFGRWPFQFARWGGEMLGYNRPLAQKVFAGRAAPEEIGEWLGKTATGWGGLYLVDKLYDRVDFRSMEYVDADENRIRLASREPIATSLWLLATIKGDVDRSAAALQFTSLPGAQTLGSVTASAVGPSRLRVGLLTDLLANFQTMLTHRGQPISDLADNFTESLNRLIPGQALLNAIKTVIDPTVREGVGANLPGVSLLKPPVIHPTTGDPLRPTQRILGSPAGPSIGGTPIPGATRQLDDVEKLLFRHGLQTYRGPRQPIAGELPADAPAEVTREWKEEFGRARAIVFGPLVADPVFAAGVAAMPKQAAVDFLRQLDSQASQIATATLNARYPSSEPDRKLPGRLRAGPRAFEE